MQAYQDDVKSKESLVSLLDQVVAVNLTGKIQQDVDLVSFRKRNATGHKTHLRIASFSSPDVATSQCSSFTPTLLPLCPWHTELTSCHSLTQSVIYLNSQTLFPLHNSVLVTASCSLHLSKELCCSLSPAVHTKGQWKALHNIIFSTNICRIYSKCDPLITADAWICVSA